MPGVNHTKSPVLTGVTSDRSQCSALSDDLYGNILPEPIKHGQEKAMAQPDGQTMLPATCPLIMPATRPVSQLDAMSEDHLLSLLQQEFEHLEPLVSVLMKS